MDLFVKFPIGNKLYLKKNRFQYLECVVSPGRRDSHAATPSGSSRRKRKRLHETLSSLVRNDSPAIHKRRSSVSDAGLLSISGSFLDCTTSPDKGLLDQAEAATVETPRKNLSPRQQVFLELIQTESNYVNILHTIMTVSEYFISFICFHQFVDKNKTYSNTLLVFNFAIQQRVKLYAFFMYSISVI